MRIPTVTYTSIAVVLATSATFVNAIPLPFARPHSVFQHKSPLIMQRDANTTQAPPPPPSNGNPKYVFAHFMVGNSYPYTIDNWASDIALAHANGIDAFALNIGSDPWQPQRVADA